MKTILILLILVLAVVGTAFGKGLIPCEDYCEINGLCPDDPKSISVATNPLPLDSPIIGSASKTWGSGYSAAAAADVNGDGYKDIIVGNAVYPGDGSGKGAIYVSYGSHCGIQPDTVPCDIGKTNNFLGGSISAVGDLNNDGFEDIIAGGCRGDGLYGHFFLYLGSRNGLQRLPADSISSYETPTGNSGFAGSMAGAGDLDADGYDDIVIGASLAEYPDTDYTSAGVAYVYYGNDSGINHTPTILQSNQAGANFGYSLSPAGDLNQDGVDDLMVGAYFYNSTYTDEGAVFIYYGRRGLGVNTIPSDTLVGGMNNIRFGISITLAGRLNDDEYDDIIIGAYQYGTPQTIGAAYVYYGSANGVSSSSRTFLTEGLYNQNYGMNVGSVGDYDCDGFDDVLVTAHGYPSGTNSNSAGKVFLYKGSSNGIEPLPSLSFTGSHPLAKLGAGVLGFAGYVNGDHFSDLVLMGDSLHLFYGDSCLGFVPDSKTCPELSETPPTGFALFPNPGNASEFKLRAFPPVRDPIRIRVFDSMGREVRSFELLELLETVELTQLATLRSGAYYLLIQSLVDERQAVIRFVVGVI
jgi:hypothetical protein